MYLFLFLQLFFLLVLKPCYLKIDTFNNIVKQNISVVNCYLTSARNSDGGLYRAYRVLKFMYSNGGLYKSYRVLKFTYSDGGLYRAYRVSRLMYSGGGLYRAYRV